MLTSDSNTKYTLRIRVDDDYKYLIKISVFNSENRIISSVEKSRNHYLFQLTRGLYTVRVEMNAEISDKIIPINSDQEYVVSSETSQYQNAIVISPPNQFSSALLEGLNVKTYDSSHEYYTYPAIELSKNDTFTYDTVSPIQSNSSLFIFMRFPSIEKYNNLRGSWSKSFYRDFEIVNEFGEKILHFDSRIGLEVNENDGWLAFNAKLPNGIYYLIYHGSEPRQIPIYVFKNWHTQFFMTLGEVPLFGTIRIFIAASRVYNPKEESNKYIDILLDKLQNGDYSVDEELINIAASGKYKSPMLVLICSYVYFKSPQTKIDALFNIIAQNMKNVILKDNEESPDLRALNILATEHLGKTNLEKKAVQGTPMLRIGFEAIKNASISNRNLIVENSVNDFISETLFYDSPFNTFKPIQFYKKPEKSSESGMYGRSIENHVVNEAQPRPFGNSLEIGDTEKFKKIQSNKAKDKFSMSIREYLKPNVFDFIVNSNFEVEGESNWVKCSIADLISTNNQLSINDISTQLNLSGITISRIFDNWTNELSNK